MSNIPDPIALPNIVSIGKQGRAQSFRIRSTTDLDNETLECYIEEEVLQNDNNNRPAFGRWDSVDDIANNKQLELKAPTLQSILSQFTWENVTTAITFCTTNTILLLEYWIYPTTEQKKRKLFANGFKWIGNAMLLVLFAVLLLPGFLQVVFYYFFSPNLIKGIAYGKKHRQNLDIYLPSKDHIHQTFRGNKKKSPVVIFFCGGAWTIGYKCWGALMGKTLAENDIVLVTPDYRNFPQVTVPGMVRDSRNAIQWVFENIEAYGGDPENIFLIGQSAGAHLSMLTLLVQAQSEAKSSPQWMQKNWWSVQQLRSYVGISGPYDIPQLLPFFASRGLQTTIIHSIFGTPKSKSCTRKQRKQWLDDLSPTALIRNKVISKSAMKLLPPLLLLHGDKDNTCPVNSTTDLHAQFSKYIKDSNLQLKIYPGKTHTDPIIEDPMKGSSNGPDPLINDVLLTIQAYSTLDFKISTESTDGLLPAWLVDAAGYVNPF